MPGMLLVALAAPYILAFALTLVVDRLAPLPVQPSAAALAINHAGRMSGAQRRAVALFALPEIAFGVVCLAGALLLPSPSNALLALRWGLAGMALVRLGIMLPVWRDLLEGRVQRLHGPLRKIQVGRRRALATEDGPFVVLPVDAALFAAHNAGDPVTISYAAHSKRVLAVAAAAPAIEQPASQAALHIAA